MTRSLLLNFGQGVSGSEHISSRLYQCNKKKRSPFRRERALGSAYVVRILAHQNHGWCLLRFSYAPWSLPVGRAFMQFRPQSGVITQGSAGLFLL